MAPSDAPTPDELEQQQSATREDVEDDVVAPEDDRPLTPDEIEQRQEVGWDDEDEPYEG